jgi:hypothetical protein
MELFVLAPHMLVCRHLCTGVDADVYAGFFADAGADERLRVGRSTSAALLQGYFLINYLEQSRIVVHR